MFFLFIGFITPASAEKPVPILIYHSIDRFSGHGSKELYVTSENFKKQMAYLKNHGFTLLTFERWQQRNQVKKPIFVTFDDGYKNNLNAFAVFQKLQDNRFKPAATIFAISDFIGRPNRLNSKELKMLSDSGYFSIQSHTATHPDLTKINTFEYQLKNSKEKIEKITGKPIIALAYPFGKYNAKIVQETKKYYEIGLRASSGNPELERNNKDYLIPRSYIFYSTTIDEFARIVDKK